MRDETAGSESRPAPRYVPGSARELRASPFGGRSVGAYVPRLTRKAFEKYGFSAATLLTDWSTIVGADLARHTEPERLRWPKGVAVYEEAESDARGRPGATLILRVDAAHALELQYKGRQIIERINAYFGYRAVESLRLVQGVPPVAERPRPAPPARQSAPVPELDAIADAALRHALERMAHGIVMRKSS
jgi:hypothetical protein